MPIAPSISRRRIALPASYLLGALALLLIPIQVILAGPTLGDLLAACERGLARNNTGVDAAMCEWYAVPCDCKLTRAGVNPGVVPDTDPGRDMEPWCIPATEAIDDAMLVVVGELRRQPDLTLSAEKVVPRILARLYPCTE
ncbi:MAG: Rap1a/Tai family immunity protein [Thiohalocapsa sp.]